MAPLEALLSKANNRVQCTFDDLICFKGLRLSAVDGSKTDLPSRSDLEKEFGRPHSTGKRKARPQAQLVTLDWVRIGWFHAYSLVRYDAAELTVAKLICQALGLGDLLLADRLFFSPLWFRELDERGVKFLFRANLDRWNVLSKASIRLITRLRRKHCGHVDAWVKLHVRQPHRGKRIGTLRIRYLEVPQPGRDTLRFFTNLSGDILTVEEAVKLYFERWGIETDFRLFKGADHLPVVISRKADSVRQEVLLRILAHNSVRYVQGLACVRQRELEQLNEVPKPVVGSMPQGWQKRFIVEQRPILPIDLQTGPAIAAIIGHLNMRAINPLGDEKRMLDDLLSEVLKHKIYAKPGRQFPRYGRKKRQKSKKSKGNRQAQNKRIQERKALARQEVRKGET